MLDRRSFLRSTAGLTALSLLAACGGDEKAAPTASGQDGGFPATVRHELGSTEIPARPQRIVCGTDGGELCSLLALGIEPVGFGQRNDPLRPWLRDLATGIDSYDLSGGETNFEQLASWAPDLLLVQKGFATEETLSRFSQLAPTVATSFVDWRQNLRQVAAAVGESERATALEQEKDAFVAEAADRVAAAKGKRVRALAAFSDGSVYQLNDASPLGKLAAALGLAPLPAAKTEGEAVDQLSLEQLSQADGDLLLLLRFGGDGDGTDALKERAVFGQLAAVRAGRVVEVGEDDANALYFDAVLTVEPNTRYLERTVTTLLL